MQTLLQSSTARPLIFFLYDSSDHVTGKTGLSPTVVISKNGASFGSPSGAVSEIGNGFYMVAGNATDTNTLGTLILSATASGADQGTMAYNVVAYAQDNATNLGLTDLDATVSSRLASASYTAPDNTSITAIKAKTDNLPAAPASTTNITGGTITTVTNLTNAPTNGDFTAAMKASLNSSTPSVAVPTANQNADALLARNIDGGSSVGRTVAEALAFLRNRWTLSGSTLTVYDTDDTTVLWTADISTDATAIPVVGSNPL